MNSLCVLCDPGLLRQCLLRYLRLSMSDVLSHTSAHPLTNVTSLSREYLDRYDIFLCVAFDTESLLNPVGFRTAWKLADYRNSLVLFNRLPPPPLPRTGPFWLTLGPQIAELRYAIETRLREQPPRAEDFEELTRQWPLLAFAPDSHRSHRGR